MKKFLQLIPFLILPFFASSQNCGQELYDNYSDSSLWTHLGTTTYNVYIRNGVLNFNDVYDGQYDKLIRQLPVALSPNYWKAEFKFTITAPNPAGDGTGDILFAASAGNLDFVAYDSTMPFPRTDQDGISVMIQSPTPSDNTIDDWQFIIYNKLGTASSQSPSGINASSSINTYFVRLERFSIDSTRLSVFSDSLFSAPLPGSPFTFAVDSTTAPLTYIQQGSQTSGNALRGLSATIDNLYICDEQFAGINQVAAQPAFDIYPNPATDALNITLPPVASSVEVYNTLGQKIYQANEMRGNIVIDVSTYENGLYFLRTVSGNDYSVKKFTVQR